jgi:hypothetical protein
VLKKMRSAIASSGAPFRSTEEMQRAGPVSLKKQVRRGVQPDTSAQN